MCLEARCSRPQVPGFYSLLELDALLLPDSVTWLRIGFVTVMLAGLVGVYLLAWTFGGSRAGAFAALLAVLSPPLTLVGARAHRSVPPDLTDTSYVRLLTGSLTRSDIARDLRRYDVRAVLAGDRLLRGPQRIDLNRVFTRRVRIGDSVLFVRRDAARR